MICLSRHLTRASIVGPTYSLYLKVYLFCISHPEKVKAYIKESGWAAQFERVGGSLEILSSSVCTSAGDVMRELDQLGLIERCVSSLLQQHNNTDKTQFVSFKECIFLCPKLVCLFNNFLSYSFCSLHLYFLFLMSLPSSSSSSSMSTHTHTTYRSDPFVLVSGDVVSNVDLKPSIEAHKARRKERAENIMTVLYQKVGRCARARPFADDLIVGLDDQTHQIVFYSDDPADALLKLPNGVCVRDQQWLNVFAFIMEGFYHI